MRRLLLAMWTTVLWAQVPRPPEPLTSWLYYKEIAIPRNLTGLADFVLDHDMLDAARVDQSDVRLYDAGGKEIPYVLRVRRDVDNTDVFTAREFNRGGDAASTQVSFDLGEQPQQHNEVEIETAGDNFRRLVEVQGSDDNKQWSTLVSGAILFRFTAGGRTAEKKSVAYPVSRYRYLRLRLQRDPQVDSGPPELKSVQVRRSVRIKGEMVTMRGTEMRDADRVNGRPGSVWRIDFGGRTPMERLVFTVGDPTFSRPFQVEAADDPGSPVMLASGELLRRENAGDGRVSVAFAEHFARRVKLTVTDDRNPALSIVDVAAMSAARQVIFRTDSAGSGPVKVYYGSYKAIAPHYDLAVELHGELSPAPLRLQPGPQRDNPIYSPEPRPFSERLPWLVYIVLGAASLVLAAILLSLVGHRRGKCP